MPIPSVLVTRFFLLVAARRFAEAERELERIKLKIQKTEWNRGYFRALHGFLIARKSNNDQYSFFSKLDFSDRKALKDYRKEFRRHVQSKLHDDFDRGFFSAWADCMRVLGRLTPSSEGQDKTDEDQPQTLDEKHDQAKIDSYVKE